MVVLVRSRVSTPTSSAVRAAPTPPSPRSSCSRVSELGRAGAVLAIPARGTALFLAPHARGLARALTGLGRVRQFWCSDGDDAPLQLRASLRFLASWTASAHARLERPVSPALYWHRGGRPLAVLTADARRPFTAPLELVDPLC